MGEPIMLNVWDQFTKKELHLFSRTKQIHKILGLPNTIIPLNELAFIKIRDMMKYRPGHSPDSDCSRCAAFRKLRKIWLTLDTAHPTS